MTRRVLLSGGAGFVGSHVAEAYLAAGDEVTVLDDLSTGRRENLPRGVRFVHADIRSAEARDLLAQGRFELLNHHAAQMDVRRSVADPLFDLDVNLRGLLNLLEGARAGGVRRVVFASSGGVVYGDATAPPCREGAAKLPISPYGVAKLASEHYLMAYSRLYGLDVASLRYSNVYGPRQNAEGEAGVVAIFSRKMLAGEPLTIFGDGEQTRDMVYVKDVAAANLAASDRPLPPPEGLDTRAWNIGTGVETSVKRLAELLAAAAGRRPAIRYAPERPGELRRSALAVEKAGHELGWAPRTGLADGLGVTLRSLAED
ncbi:MAG: UDP-glucose 4-epimerase [Gemmatimonadetes bacterium]|nr:MAG: UDP-glucose 4-epimerase [Gemmatimonadota bacterium]